MDESISNNYGETGTELDSHVYKPGYSFTYVRTNIGVPYGPPLGGPNGSFDLPDDGIWAISITLDYHNSAAISEQIITNNIYFAATGSNQSTQSSSVGIAPGAVWANYSVYNAVLTTVAITPIFFIVQNPKGQGMKTIYLHSFCYYTPAYPTTILQGTFTVQATLIGYPP